jgi:hypothetical protein
MAKPPSLEETARKIADMALDGIEYKGKSLREWIDQIANGQSEWISVDERLPERNGRYLTHCNIEGQSLVCILCYCKVGGFNEGTVTHWMPLPTPPKEDKNA